LHHLAAIAARAVRRRDGGGRFAPFAGAFESAIRRLDPDARERLRGWYDAPASIDALRVDRFVGVLAGEG
jgi:hypothetical protein